MQFCDGTNWISITGSSSGAAGVMDDNKGGLTVSGSGAMWTINSASIQYSKIQNVSGSSLLGRYAATSGLTTSSGSVQTGHAGSSGTIIVIELP
ncbi:MAG: hypothetical protein BGO82_14175 [Devosia sp. 67-54]|nr:MAG: hypothetical protein BGO82_14175 [Devosia sp. 67-54]